MDNAAALAELQRTGARLPNPYAVQKLTPMLAKDFG